MGPKGAVDPAIDVANQMKLAGTKMFGIAVGSVSLNPIKAVTNKVPYDRDSTSPTAGLRAKRTATTNWLSSNSGSWLSICVRHR